MDTPSQHDQNRMGIDALLCPQTVDPLATAVAAANIMLVDRSKLQLVARDLELPPLRLLPPLQKVDGAKMRETKPGYRDDTLVIAREKWDKWREANQEMYGKISGFIRMNAELAKLVPPSFFRHVYHLKGKRQALFLQLVWLSLNQKVELTFSQSFLEGFHGITEVRVAADAIEAFDAMPIPTQRAIKARGSRALQTLAALWREATFKESVTSDGGLVMKHEAYVPKTDKQRERHAQMLKRTQHAIV